MSAKEVEDTSPPIARRAAVAVVGKQHELLDQVVGGVRDHGAGRPDDDAMPSEIIETLHAQLADFKVPRAVYFVEEFPTGTLDKILKNKLREMADDQPPVD